MYSVVSNTSPSPVHGHPRHGYSLDLKVFILEKMTATPSQSGVCKAEDSTYMSQTLNKPKSVLYGNQPSFLGLGLGQVYSLLGWG